MASLVKTKKSTRKMKNISTREELSELNSDELIERVMQLEAHVFQLKNVIKKKGEPQELDEPCNQSSSKAGRPFNFKKHHIRHVLIKLLYLGWQYQGYTVQDDSTETIEHYLFEALKKSCLVESRETSNYHRCGRTDKGVSAFCQVISIDLRSCLSPETENDLSKELPYIKMLNRLLPEKIKAIAWSPAPSSTVSARFDCVRRSYHYLFPRANLNIEAMQKAMSYLLGPHDFRNLCKMDVGNGVVNFKRTIIYAHIKVINSEARQFESCNHEEVNNVDESSQFQNSENPYDFCELVITGKAFLWHQIRCIASVLFLIGKGVESPEVVLTLCDPDACPSKPQYSLASEIPLCLFECSYDIPLNWFYDQSELVRLIGGLQKHWTGYSIKAEMIRQMLFNLETKSTTQVTQHSEGLITGVRSKTYIPLLERGKCSSLENRIAHYVKRRKLEKVPNETTS